MDNAMKQREAEEILREAGGQFSAPPPKTPQEKRPLHRELPPPEPYPIEALGPLADAAKAVATLTQAPRRQWPRKACWPLPRWPHKPMPMFDYRMAQCGPCRGSS